MFLDSMPLTTFTVNNDESIVVRDFIRAIRIDPGLKNNPFNFTVYSAKDNETPEIISHMFYQTTMYHWIIMLFNEKFDPLNDFPKSDELIRKQTVNQFGSLNAVHHYENDSGEWVDEFTIEAERIPVTNYEYMTKLNEDKRPVKILRKELVSEFVQLYKGAMLNG